MAPRLPTDFTFGPIFLGVGVLLNKSWMVSFGTVLLTLGLVISVWLLTKQEERIATLESALQERLPSEKAPNP